MARTTLHVEAPLVEEAGPILRHERLCARVVVSSPMPPTSLSHRQNLRLQALHLQSTLFLPQ